MHQRRRKCVDQRRSGPRSIHQYSHLHITRDRQEAPKQLMLYSRKHPSLFPLRSRPPTDGPYNQLKCQIVLLPRFPVRRIPCIETVRCLIEVSIWIIPDLPHQFRVLTQCHHSLRHCDTESVARKFLQEVSYLPISSQRV